MAEEEKALKYYWYGPWGIGAGKKTIKRGDPLPDNFDRDPRFEKWLEAGYISDEEFVSFEAEQAERLEKAEAKIRELEKTNASLAQELEKALSALEKAKAPKTRAKK